MHTRRAQTFVFVRDVCAFRVHNTHGDDMNTTHDDNMQRATYANERARVMRALRAYDDTIEHYAKSRRAHIVTIDDVTRDDVYASIVNSLTRNNATTIIERDDVTLFITNVTCVYLYKHDGGYVSIDVLRARDAHDDDV
jgi:hypothetical protein